MITLEQIKEKTKALKLGFIREENYEAAAELREIELMLIDYEAVEELMEESEYESRYRMNIEAEFEDYAPRVIEEGIQLLEKYYPNQKLQAVKEFRDLIKGWVDDDQPILKLSKEFMDFGWKEIGWENSIKGPIG